MHHHWKTRFALVVGGLALLAFTLGAGEVLTPLHFGW
jgi:hypothetical protein